MLYKASGTYVLLIVCNVLVEVVVICFLGRDDKAFYGQQCVLTNWPEHHVLLKTRSLLCVGGDGAQVLSLVEHDANGLQSRRSCHFTLLSLSLFFCTLGQE